MSVETATRQRRADRLQIVGNTIRRMKEAPAGTPSKGWDDLQLCELSSDRQIDSFNMAIWLAGETRPEYEARHSKCKTMGCIAGTTVTLFRNETGDPEPFRSPERTTDVAGSILGLDEKTAYRLFAGPPTFRRSLASVTREEAAQACDKTAAGCRPEDIWSHVVD